ncbi:MAG: U32 family peptidase C-terminal domain-containing protein, partial [Candidatus Izimaplasma sp.]|nr:U32 family peptidase C-terminal domain-containing protein [Candidatus Izimaplasma bacterium]
RSENPSQEFIAFVHEYDEENFIATIEQRNHFLPGEEVEVFSPNFESMKFKIDEIIDIEGNILDAARHPKQLLKIFIPFKVSKYDMIRKIKT